MSFATDELLYDVTGETDGYAPALPILKQASQELEGRPWTPSRELALSPGRSRSAGGGHASAGADAETRVELCRSALW